MCGAEPNAVTMSLQLQGIHCASPGVRPALQNFFHAPNRLRSIWNLAVFTTSSTARTISDWLKPSASCAIFFQSGIGRCMEPRVEGGSARELLRWLMGLAKLDPDEQEHSVRAGRRGCVGQIMIAYISGTFSSIDFRRGFGLRDASPPHRSSRSCSPQHIELIEQIDGTTLGCSSNIRRNFAAVSPMYGVIMNSRRITKSGR